jgi:hypothetical protein
MNSHSLNPSFESRDAFVVVLNDSDLEVDTSPGQASDESLRRYLRQWFATDLKSDAPAANFERLLILAREGEQFCRGSNDLFGLARCLGNQALVHKACGNSEKAMALLKELETLSRRADDVEGVTFALGHQADLFQSSFKQPGTALSLAEQARQMAAENNLTQMLGYLDPLLERIRDQLRAA